MRRKETGMDEGCQQAVRRLHLFVDRELSSQEVSEVRQHLDDCPPCRERFQFQASLKRLIHDRVAHESCPEEVRSRLFSSLLQKKP